MQSKEQALEVAMLARMVGSHLHHVDSVTGDTSKRANKINMQKFVAPLTGQAPPPTNPVYEDVDPAVRQAYADVERMALMQVPDTSVGAQVAQAHAQQVPVIAPPSIGEMPPVPAFQQPIGPIPPPAQPIPLAIPIPEYALTKEDVQKIIGRLERIDATLPKFAGMAVQFREIAKFKKNDWSFGTLRQANRDDSK